MSTYSFKIDFYGIFADFRDAQPGKFREIDQERETTLKSRHEARSESNVKIMLLQATNYELLTRFFHAFLDDFDMLSTPIPCSMLEDVDRNTCRLRCIAAATQRCAKIDCGRRLQKISPSRLKKQNKTKKV